MYHLLVTDSLMKCLWKFIDKHRIVLDVKISTPKALREGDSSVIDTTIRNGTYGTTELEEINRCRKCLQIVTGAYMTTGCGRYIERRYLEYPRKRPRASK